MIAIIAFIVFVLVAFAILGFAVHLLLSPWLWLLAAVALLAWYKFRPRRSHR